MNYSKRRWFGMPLLILAVTAALGTLLMLIWNALMPQLFHLQEITFWQALLLLIFCRILFGGHFRQHSLHHQDFHEKMHKMTKEEREEFRKKFMRIRRNWCFSEMDNNKSGNTAAQETENN